MPKRTAVDRAAATRRRQLYSLRRKMRAITTRVQLEEILTQSHPDHRAAMRKFLTPMLREGLPCCGIFELCRAAGEPPQHATLCPDRPRETARLIHLTDDYLSVH